MLTLADPEVQASTFARIRALRSDAPARWGRMTAHQMVCHLSDAYRLPLREKSAGTVKPPIPPTLMKFVAFRVPLPWPKGVATMPEMDQCLGGTRPLAFEQDRAGLITLVERFCAAAGSFGDIAHPLFGPMSDSEWMRWGYLHADHHLRQFGA